MNYYLTDFDCIRSEKSININQIDISKCVKLNQDQVDFFVNKKIPNGMRRKAGTLMIEEDESNKRTESDLYIINYDAVDSKRRSLYTHMSDPLYSKARRLERNGEIEKANDYYAQADAAVDKIKSENPWPTPLES